LKSLGKLALVALLFAGLGLADEVKIGSWEGDNAQWNSIGNDISIASNGWWMSHYTWSSPSANSSQWLSFAQTGDPNQPNYVAVSSGTVVSFYLTFNIPGTPQDSTVRVAAADSAAVYLNGTLIQAEATQTGNTYYHCSDFPIGCVGGNDMTISIPAAQLHTGNNRLEFRVAKRGGSNGFGVMYLLDLFYTPGTTCP
jgi:hypothetical protein